MSKIRNIIKRSAASVFRQSSPSANSTGIINSLNNLSADLGEFLLEHTKVKNILNGLAHGSEDDIVGLSPTLDATTVGLDGSVLFTERASTNTAPEYIHSRTLNRPLTVKESIIESHTSLKESIDAIVIETPDVVSDYTIEYIGEKAFDTSSSSSSTSIDGRLTSVESIIDSLEGGGGAVDLDPIKLFIGMADSDTATYSDHNAITIIEDGDSLEEAVAKLDLAISEFEPGGGEGDPQTLAEVLATGNSTGGLGIVAAAGGNTRGAGAIDFQIAREDDTQVASGVNSLLGGTYSTSSGENAFAWGKYAVSSGEASFAAGMGAESTGYGSHAEGAWTEASGYGSHAEGNGSMAKPWADDPSLGLEATASHAEGNSRVYGNYSHAEGHSNLVYGCYGAHAEGNGNVIGRPSSRNTSSGFQQAAWDSYRFSGSDVNSDFAHAEGVSGEVLAACSHGGGMNVLTTVFGQWARGGAKPQTPLARYAQGATQMSSYILSGESNNAVAVDLFANSVGDPQVLLVRQNSAYHFRVSIVAAEVSASPLVEAACWDRTFSGLIRRTPYTQATATVTVGIVLPGDTITIGGLVFTAVSGTATAGAREFDVSSGSASTISSRLWSSIMSPLNLCHGVQTGYVGKVGLVLTLESYLLGAAGNGVTVATSAPTRLVLGGATMTGGLDSAVTMVEVTPSVATTPTMSDAGAATWTAIVTAVNPGELRITCNGENGKRVAFTARVDTIEIARAIPYLPS